MIATDAAVFVAELENLLAMDSSHLGPRRLEIRKFSSAMTREKEESVAAVVNGWEAYRCCCPFEAMRKNSRS